MLGVDYSYLLINLFVRAGELAELKADLQSDKKEKRKEAVKKIIASMTVGKDVRYVVYILCTDLTNDPMTCPCDCVHTVSHATWLADTQAVNIAIVMYSGHLT